MAVREERRYVGIEGAGTHDEPGSSNFLWRHWNSFTSFLAFACAVGIWGLAITTVDDHKKIGIYLIFCGIIVSFLEISFVLEKLFGCCSEQSFARKCWLVVLAVDHWKRGLLYLVLSIACYLDPKRLVHVLVAGVLMDLCGLLYLIKTVKHKKKPEPYKYKQLSVT